VSRRNASGQPYALARGPEPGVAHPAATLTIECYPNPARTRATLRFALPGAQRLDVRVFDILGRQMAVLAKQTPMTAGVHELTWVPPAHRGGMYFFAFNNGIGRITRKFIVLR